VKDLLTLLSKINPDFAYSFTAGITCGLDDCEYFRMRVKVFATPRQSHQFVLCRYWPRRRTTSRGCIGRSDPDIINLQSLFYSSCEHRHAVGKTLCATVPVIEYRGSAYFYRVGRGGYDVVNVGNRRSNWQRSASEHTRHSVPC
jgi:hypothetical protein